MSKTLLLVIIFFLLLVPIASAQVVINEFSSSTSHDDWIEIYALEDTTLTGYKLTHLTTEGDESEMATFPSVESISKGEFLIVDARNYLNKDGDVIRLYKPDNSVEEISYGDKGGVCSPSSNGSVGRLWQNGVEGTNWIDHFSNQTKLLSNKDNILEPCPSPTLEPTETTTPTNTPKTPTPIPTPKPTSTPTPAPTKPLSSTPTTYKKITVTSVSQNEDELSQNTLDDEDKADVLGIQEVSSKKVSPTPEEEKGDGNKFPLAAVVFIVSGTFLIGIALYPIFVKWKARLQFNK